MMTLRALVGHLYPLNFFLPTLSKALSSGQSGRSQRMQYLAQAARPPSARVLATCFGPGSGLVRPALHRPMDPVHVIAASPVELDVARRQLQHGV